MPSIKDASTVEAIAREYCSNGRYKARALETIGYSKGYSNTQGIGVVYGNVRVKDAIARIDAKTTAKLDHDRTIAIAILNEALAIAREKHDSAGIVQACRELDAISNLHSNTVHTDTELPDELTDAQRDELRLLSVGLTSSGLKHA